MFGEKRGGDRTTASLVSLSVSRKGNQNNNTDRAPPDNTSQTWTMDRIEKFICHIFPFKRYEMLVENINYFITSRSYEEILKLKLVKKHCFSLRNY